jgi:hypothetical protein
LWIAFAMVLAVRIIEWLSRQRLRQTARFVIAFSAAVLFLRLLGILHPSKALVDAVFQAHRFESVLAGRYYFTQPMPGGVQFPYAITSRFFGLSCVPPSASRARRCIP